MEEAAGLSSKARECSLEGAAVVEKFHSHPIRPAFACYYLVVHFMTCVGVKTSWRYRLRHVDGGQLVTAAGSCIYKRSALHTYLLIYLPDLNLALTTSSNVPTTRHPAMRALHIPEFPWLHHHALLFLLDAR